MAQRHIQKKRSFFSFFRNKRFRPGFAGNFLFLVLSVGLVVFIAQSEYLNDFPVKKQPLQESEPARLFSDDDLLFYQDTITGFLLRRNFNGSVLLARRGEVLFSRSFGFADYRNNTPLTQDTPFQLASISKTFTATAVLMLHDRGQLNIDNRVKTYIPEFPYPDITVRQLLNHTSGLHNYMYLLERFWKEDRPPTNEDVLDLFVDYPHYLNFRPGTRFSYSNTGYAFLGLLVERVSGKPFCAFMHDEVFGPLHLSNTFVYNPRRPDEMPSGRAHGFRPWRRTHLVIPDVVHDNIMGDKGIYSTIHDLYSWDRAIHNGNLLPDSLWEAAFEHTRLANNRTVRYGMGWRLQTFMNRHVVHHPGRWNGFHTSLKRFVEDDATLILLNNDSRNITYLVESLQNILFLQEIEEEDHPPEKEDPSEYHAIGGGSQ